MDEDPAYAPEKSLEEVEREALDREEYEATALSEGEEREKATGSTKIPRTKTH